MNNRHSKTEFVSPVTALAVLSVLLLLGLVGLRAVGFIRTFFFHSKSQQAAPASVVVQPANSEITWQRDLYDVSNGTVAAYEPSDTDGLSNIGSNVVGALASQYAAMQASGGYTDARGDRVGDNVAATLQAKVSYQTYIQSDFSTTSASYDHLLAYRADMRTALAPLLNNTDYELKIYAQYIASHDEVYVGELKKEIANYKAAITNMKNVTVPSDLLAYHISIINAVSAFAATLDAMTLHADDPFASAALLRTYQSSERGMIDAFNALAQYERTQKP